MIDVNKYAVDFVKRFCIYYCSRDFGNLRTFCRRWRSLFRERAWLGTIDFDRFRFLGFLSSADVSCSIKVGWRAEAFN